MKTWTNKSLIIFIVTVIILSSIVEAGIIMKDLNVLYPVLMWIPGLMAVVSNVISIVENKEKITLKTFINRLGFRKTKIRYILLAILIPLIYLLIPYMFYWKKYPNDFAYTGVPIHIILSDILLPLILGIFLGLLTALGEELGWRGYMLPAFKERVGINKSLLITSLFWVMWHLPLLIFGNYMSGATLWYKVIAFILCIVPVGIIIGILTIKSNSVWPAAFLHAAHNNYDQGIFGIITRGDKMMYYVSETGVITIICVWIIAIGMLLYYKNKLN